MHGKKLRRKNMSFSKKTVDVKDPVGSITQNVCDEIAGFPRVQALFLALPLNADVVSHPVNA